MNVEWILFALLAGSVALALGAFVYTCGYRDAKLIVEREKVLTWGEREVARIAVQGYCMEGGTLLPGLYGDDPSRREEVEGFYGGLLRKLGGKEIVAQLSKPPVAPPDTERL